VIRELYAWVRMISNRGERRSAPGNFGFPSPIRPILGYRQR